MMEELEKERKLEDIESARSEQSTLRARTVFSSDRNIQFYLSLKGPNCDCD
jgi:hypothetical protein